MEEVSKGGHLWSILVFLLRLIYPPPFDCFPPDTPSAFSQAQHAHPARVGSRAGHGNLMIQWVYVATSSGAKPF
eukprot:7679086-Pyramimonas_sp.AAC.1